MNVLWYFTALIVCRIVFVGSINCDFDGSQCGYATLRNGRGFYWERNRIRNARSMGITGPRIDHSTGTDRGGVMFSRQLTVNNIGSAKLTSPVQRSPLCFIHFSYYMNHPSLVRLTVSIIETNNRPRSQLNISGNRGSQWHEVTIPVQSATNGEWKLQFEAFVDTRDIDGRKTYFLDDIKGQYCNCSTSYCNNGGTCADTELGASCQCPPGFTGDTCQTNIDECPPNPCQNGGTCQDRINGFTCQCVPGFTGSTCQTNIDECPPNPCQNGGTCQDRINGFTCQCVPGFTGDTCQTNLDECSGNPCLNNGACRDGINGHTCQCAPGFTGLRCQSNIDECSGNPCQNGGTCQDGVNGFSCHCLSHYTGSRCEVIIDHVSSPPTTADPHASGADKLCLVCQRIQHPQQCTTFVKTWPYEACETQHIALPNGTLVFNLGFTNKRNCEGGTHRERRQVLVDGVMLCHKCCVSDLCNHKLCIPRSSSDTRLACITGESTGISGQTSVRYCDPDQLCYTDRPTHGRPGQLRYDCVSQAFCNRTVTANSHPESCRVCCNTDGCNAHKCGIF